MCSDAGGGDINICFSGITELGYCQQQCRWNTNQGVILRSSSNYIICAPGQLYTVFYVVILAASNLNLFVLHSQ